jgi:hypothetical protein
VFAAAGYLFAALDMVKLQGYTDQKFPVEGAGEIIASASLVGKTYQTVAGQMKADSLLYAWGSWLGPSGAATTITGSAVFTGRGGAMKEAAGTFVSTPTVKLHVGAGLDFSAALEGTSELAALGGAVQDGVGNLLALWYVQPELLGEGAACVPCAAEFAGSAELLGAGGLAGDGDGLIAAGATLEAVGEENWVAGSRGTIKSQALLQARSGDAGSFGARLAGSSTLLGAGGRSVYAPAYFESESIARLHGRGAFIRPTAGKINCSSALSSYVGVSYDESRASYFYARTAPKELWVNTGEHHAG